MTSKLLGTLFAQLVEKETALSEEDLSTVYCYVLQSVR